MWRGILSSLLALLAFAAAAQDMPPLYTYPSAPAGVHLTSGAPMTAVVGKRSVSSLAAGSRTNSTFTPPSGLADNDTLVAILDVGAATSPAVTPPAGFGEVTSAGWPITYTKPGDSWQCKLRLFTKRASGESGNYTFTHTTATTEGILYALTDADAVDPVQPDPSANYNQSATYTPFTITALGVTTPADGSFVIFVAGAWDQMNASPPSGSTPTFEEDYDGSTSGVFYAASGVLTAQGATGNKTLSVPNGSATWGAALISIQPSTAPPPQSVGPTADLTVDNWQGEDSSTSNIYTHIDEAIYSDSDYIRTQLSPSSDVYVCSLGTLSDPQSSAGHILHFRYGKDAASGDVLSLTAELRQGYANEGSLGTLIATALNNADIGSGWTQVDYTLSGAEADAISDYTALAARLVGNRISGAPANPSVRAVGTRASGTTSVAFTTTGIPTNLEGDLIFIAIETSDSTTLAGTPADITDWTKVLADTTSGGGATGVTTLTVYGRFVPAGGIGGTVTVSGIGNHGCGFMFSVKDHGCSALSDLVIGTVTDHGTSTSSVTIASINVTANSLIIGVHGLSDDANDTNNFTAGPTNANLASISKFADETVSTGAGGGIALWSATCAGTSTGTTAWTHDTAENAQTLHIGIKPVTGVTRRAQVSWLNLEVPEVSGDVSINLGTLLSTSGIGALSKMADVLLALSGQSSAGGYGSLAETAGVTLAPTGQSIAAGLGSLSPAVSITLVPAGQVATAGIGALTVDAGAGAPVTISLAGQSSTSVLGSLSLAASAALALSGQLSTGTLGALSQTAGVTLAPTGQQSAAGIGSLTESAGASMTLSGQQSASQMGSLSESAGIGLSLTGQQSAAGIGSLSKSVGVTLAITGLSSTGQIGVLVVDVAGNVSIILPGLQTVSGIGSLGLQADVAKALTGQQISSAFGILSIGQGAGVTLTGQGAAGQIGSITVQVGASGNVNIVLDGQAALSQIGGLTLQAGAILGLLGLESNSLIGALQTTVIGPVTIQYLSGTVTIHPVLTGEPALYPRLRPDPEIVAALQRDPEIKPN